MSVQIANTPPVVAPAPFPELDPSYMRPASGEVIERVAANLRANNIEAIVVDNGDEARSAALALIPDGAEVHSGKSKTLEDIGLFAELTESGRYDAIKPRLLKMDRKTQGREMRKLGASPDYMLGSVQAVTEEGVLVVVSAGGGQIGPYASGAGRVILIVGSQKIVADVDEAMRRVEDHAFPQEDARLQAAMGIHTSIAKVLLINKEFMPGRTTVILVKEPVGI